MRRLAHSLILATLLLGSFPLAPALADGTTQSIGRGRVTLGLAGRQIVTPTSPTSETPTDPPSPAETDVPLDTPAPTEAPTSTPVATDTPAPSETPSEATAPAPASAPGALDEPTTWYVATTGDDTDTCLSPSTACATINGAIGKASSTDTVLVEEGTYTGSGDNVVIVDTDLLIVGGWDATFTARVGQSTIDGQGERRGLSVSAGVQAHMVYFEISNGLAPSLDFSGGGVYNGGSLGLESSVVSGNTAGFGGGIFNNGGSLRLLNSEVSNNRADDGGGIDNFLNGYLTIHDSRIVGNHAVNGGGLRNLGSASIERTEISSNSATGGGGGVLNGGGAELSLLNTTISLNSAGTGGGGIVNDGVLGMEFVTIVGNAAGPLAGSAIFTSGDAMMNNTILVGSCSGTIASGGFNLIQDLTECPVVGDTTGNVTGVDPLLGPLADNGGPTETYALLPGSPAIDAGGCCASEDQRGQPRPVDGNSDGDPRHDIGAFEAAEGTTPPPPPSPWLTAFPEWDFVEGFLWPLDSVVHLSIEDPATEASPDLEMDDTSEPSPWGDERTYVSYDLPGDYDLKTGDEVALTDGVTPRTLVVRNLAIRIVDEEANIVVGTADPGAVVHVWPHETGEQVDATTDPDGIWQVDLTGSYDIVPGSAGRAEIRDELYNGTAVDWSVPVPANPHLIAFPENEAVDAWEWPDGASVHLTIDDPATPDSPDHEQDGVMAVTTWGDPRTYFRFEFSGEYDLKPGDLVVVTDGTTERAHTVQNLSIAAVAVAEDTVAGMADEGALVVVWPHGFDQVATVQAMAGQDGTWLADFAGLFDIVPGTGGRAQIPDDAGNATAVDWNAPNPHFTAFPEQEVVEGWDWALDSTVHLSIDDPATGASPDLEKDGTVILAPWGSGQHWVWLDFNGEYDMKAGDVVTLTDGVTERTHIVRNLSITGVDEAADTVSGSANPGEVVNVWPHETGQQVQVTTDPEGTWQVDFTGANDIVPGSAGRSQIDDEAGNGTAVDWSAPLNYDIYVFDTRTGETKQITKLTDTGEYNPSWSRSGRKIAHDVWRSSDGSQAIYITDVATGVSTALAGAEGGNDAVWSPNDKWIAFDRSPVGDDSLYVVPAKGGARRLVRADAVAADWSPSGLRLVFHQPSDGSIRIMDSFGRNVTLVALSGDNPVWSPDGRWIAYQSQGNLWKVRVHPRGNPLGEAIRVTTGGSGDYQPTWSADSRTIAFHSGLGGDDDIWTIRATGGTATWLIGAPGFGDYDPSYSSNGRYIAYTSFAPTGQAPRLWISAFTYDPPVGAFREGNHPYHFDFDWTLPEPGTWSDQEGEVTVSGEAATYDGYVLLRGPEELRGLADGSACEPVEAIRPDQLTRFLIGWLTASEMTYAQAVAHFESISARVVWDEANSAKLVRHEIMPWPASVDDWYQYVCTYTVQP